MFENFFVKNYFIDSSNLENKVTFKIENIDSQSESYFYYFFNKSKTFERVNLINSKLKFPNVRFIFQRKFICIYLI